jgi:replicative DNA helicase
MQNLTDIDSERAIIGSLLLNPVWCEEVFSIVQEENFVSEWNKIFFSAIKQAKNENKGIDILTVSQFLPKNEGSPKLPDLADIIAGVPSASNCVDYAKRVLSMANARKIVSMGQKIANMGECGEDKMLDFIRKEISQIEKPEKSKTMAEISSEYLSYAFDIKDGKKSSSVATGYKILDDALGGGFPSGSLSIIAARTGMGKTTFALNCAYNIAMRGDSVAFISMEMGEVQMFTRLLAKKTGIPNWKLRKAEYDKTEEEKIGKALDEMRMSNFTIERKNSLTLELLSSRIHKLKRENGLKIIFVDYVQMMKGDAKWKGTKAYEIAEITKGMVDIAGELNISIVAIAQLSRESLKGNDSPELHHLKDSGSIEQDASTVIFLHDDGNEHSPQYFALIKKNRDGEKDAAIPLVFNKNLQSFSCL